MKLCPRLARFGVFDKDIGANEKKRADICLACPLDKYGLPCIYDKAGAISALEIKVLLGEDTNEVH